MANGVRRSTNLGVTERALEELLFDQPRGEVNYGTGGLGLGARWWMSLLVAGTGGRQFAEHLGSLDWIWLVGDGFYWGRSGCEWQLWFKYI